MCDLLGYKTREILHSCSSLLKTINILTALISTLAEEVEALSTKVGLGAAGYLPEAGEFPLKYILCFECIVIGILAQMVIFKKKGYM